jgi:hypothetical protein
MRIRGNLSIALHEFFQRAGFLLINTPIITKMDNENKNELFQISTLSEEIKSNWINLFNKILLINSDDYEKVSIKGFIDKLKINKNKNKNENENENKNENEENLFIKEIKEITCKLNSSFNMNNLNLNNSSDSALALDSIKDFIKGFSDYSISSIDNILLNDNEIFNNKIINYKKENRDIGNKELKNIIEEIVIKDSIEENENENENENEDYYILINSENKDKALNKLYEKIFSKVKLKFS